MKEKQMLNPLTSYIKNKLYIINYSIYVHNNRKNDFKKIKWCRWCVYVRIQQQGKTCVNEALAFFEKLFPNCFRPPPTPEKQQEKKTKKTHILRGIPPLPPPAQNSRPDIRQTTFPLN